MTADEMKDQVARAQWAEVQVLKQNEQLRNAIRAIRESVIIVINNAIAGAIVEDTK